VADRVGSIKTGKDADLVLWSDNPLSIYAKAEITIVDGIIYFDREKDMELRKRNAAEKTRLIQKLAALKKASSDTPGGQRNFQRARPRLEIIHTCMDHFHSHGLLAIDSDDLE